MLGSLITTASASTDGYTNGCLLRRGDWEAIWKERWSPLAGDDLWSILQKHRKTQVPDLALIFPSFHTTH
jgi:hypothetical protein